MSLSKDFAFAFGFGGWVGEIGSGICLPTPV